MNGNLIPAAEGFLTPEQYDAAKKEVRDFVLPLLDGTDLTEGIQLSGELFQAIMQIKGLNLEQKQVAALVGSILGDVLNDIQKDLVIIYPDEAPTS